MRAGHQDRATVLKQSCISELSSFFCFPDARGIRGARWLIVLFDSS